LLILLSGCVVAPAHRVYQPAPPVVYQQQPMPQAMPAGQPAPVVVYQAPPPPPQAEVVTVSPGPGFFWIPGIWIWEGGRHVWRGGHWEAHRPGYTYVPHQWGRVGNAWHLNGGYWRR
jgi:hypothetical protein